MSGRYSAWSAAPGRRRRINQRRRKGDVSRGRDPPTWSARRYGFTAGSAGRRWWQDLWRVTWWISMGGWQRRDGVGEPRPRGKVHVHIEWPSRPREARGSARWRGARAERRWGRQCGYTSYTGMSWTPWSLWRRETSAAHGAPSETCWSPGGHWMAGTLPQLSAPGERSGRGGV